MFSKVKSHPDAAKLEKLFPAVQAYQALAVTVLEPTPELEIEELPDVELQEGVEVGYREAA